MLYFQIFFLLLSILPNFNSLKDCTEDTDCKWYQYCSTSKKKCYNQKYGHCDTETHCPPNFKCEYSNKRGTSLCVVDTENIQEFDGILHDHTIHLDDMSSVEYQLQQSFPDEPIHQCTNEMEEIIHLQMLEANRDNFDKDLYLEKPWLMCGMNDFCSDPSNRDSFANDRRKIIVRVDWNVMKTSDNWWKTAHTKVQTLTTQLNEIYAPAGFVFQSTLKVYSLDKFAEAAGMSVTEADKLKVHKLDCFERDDDPNSAKCMEIEKVLEILRGKDWRNLDAFQLLIVKFTDDDLHGFGKFPWDEVHGMLAFVKKQIMKGKTTVMHEFGHVFGLMHTFRGYDADSCGICQEVLPSDITGDMCSDTGPTPRNWECSVDMLSMEEFPDVCLEDLGHHRNNWNDAAIGNLMSYGTCRNKFTEQQINRMRCFASLEIKNSNRVSYQ